LDRTEELEGRRARIRLSEVQGQPKSFTGIGVKGFAKRFVQAQADFMGAPSARRFQVRKKPKVRPINQILFDQSGRAVQVYNLARPNRNRHRRHGPQRSIFAPSLTRI